MVLLFKNLPVGYRKKNTCKKFFFTPAFLSLLSRITIFPRVVKPYYYLQCTINSTKEFLPNTDRCGNKGFCNHQNGRERMSQKLGILKILSQCWLYIQMYITIKMYITIYRFSALFWKNMLCFSFFLYYWWFCKTCNGTLSGLDDNN